MSTISMTQNSVALQNETPMVCGLAADNNNKLYTETMIFLWNNHYNLNFNVGLNDNSIRNEDEKHDYHA